MLRLHSCTQGVLYLVIHNHHLGVDIDLEAPMLLSLLVGGACSRVLRRGGLPIPVSLLVTCKTKHNVQQTKKYLSVHLARMVCYHMNRWCKRKPQEICCCARPCSSPSESHECRSTDAEPPPPHPPSRSPPLTSPHVPLSPKLAPTLSVPTQMRSLSS